MTTIPWKMFSFYVRVQHCGFSFYKPLTLSSLEHSFCLTQMCISWTALLKTTNRLLYLQLSALFWLTISHLACYVRKQKDFFRIPLFLGDFTKMIRNCILFSINNGGSRFLYKKGLGAQTRWNYWEQEAREFALKFYLLNVIYLYFVL